MNHIYLQTLLKEFTPEQIAVLVDRVYNNKYIINNEKPFKNQLRFLSNTSMESLYGGAAGGGKSSAILMGYLMYVEPEHGEDKVKYDGLIIRRTLSDLEMPNAIMDRAKKWLIPFEDIDGSVYWKEKKKQFIFDTGATLTFRYLAHDNDLAGYQGAEFQYIGVDELTQFSENQYTYLYSRLRKTEDNPILLRMRAGSNPGGIGHDWVKDRFLTPNKKELFIPSKYTDNKYLDQEEYSKSLDLLADEVTRQQLKYGDWDVIPSTGFFNTENLHIDQDYELLSLHANCRSYDMAYTSDKEAKQKNTDADYTAGCHAEKVSDTHYIFSDFIYKRLGEKNIQTVQRKAKVDGIAKPILIETGTVGGAAKELFRLWSKDYLPEYPCTHSEPIGTKADRAAGLKNAIYRGHIHIHCPEPSLLREIMNQLEGFPYSTHDDIIDAMAYAYNFLSKHPGGTVKTAGQRTKRRRRR